MRPGARVQAAIDVLSTIDENVRSGGAAADQVVRLYFKHHRYAGSGDRRFIRELVYIVMRNRGLFDWLIKSQAQAETPRNRMIAALAHLQDVSTIAIDVLFGEKPYGPPSLNARETAFADNIREAKLTGVPGWARLNYPEWLEPALQQRFGDQLDAEMTAAKGRASVDLRINTIKTTIEDLSDSLPPGKPSRFSPVGFRLDEAVDLQRWPVYRDGLVDVQDEGSQIAGLLCGARPGMTVLDLCAGAGGKTLVMGSQMNNEGTLNVYDINAGRLEELVKRARHQEVKIVNRIKELKELSDPMDRVVVDAPCSGTGTWRRSPELRWRLTPERLQQHVITQRELLATAAAHTAIGGQIIYITCSVLGDENEDQIEQFLAENSSFELRPYSANWPFTAERLPQTGSRLPDCLSLSPATHGTDGFFVAVLARVD